MAALPDAVRALLLRPNIAHVATVMRDGMPHVAPTWVDVEGEQIVFLTGPRSQKARNLDNDPGSRCRSPTRSVPPAWPTCVGASSIGWRTTRRGRSSTGWRTSTSAPTIRGDSTVSCSSWTPSTVAHDYS